MGPFGSMGASSAMDMAMFASVGMLPPGIMMQCQALVPSRPASWSAADRAAPCPDDQVKAATASQATVRLNLLILRLRNGNADTPFGAKNSPNQAYLQGLGPRLNG